MASFLTNIRPGGAIADFRNVYRSAGPNRWRYVLLAALCTTGTFGIMVVTQNWKGKRPLPEVTYINSWPADRTAAETKAFIVANEKKKEADAAREAAFAKDAQDMWMAVGKASGMDVDSIQKQAEADKAAEAAKTDAASKAPPQAKPAPQAKVGH